MELFTIKNIGKTFFWTSFILGNICLFGQIITKNDNFAFAGYLLLFFAGIINLLVVFGLLIYGLSYKEHYKDSLNSILIMLINIPIAGLYAWIGLSII